jgi:DNA-binding transcriptional LysR family regulator
LRKYPQLRIERREVGQTDIAQALNDCVIDIGIAMLPLEGMSISSRAIREARWQLVMPAVHALAQQHVISLDSLAGIPLLMFSRTVNQPLHDFVLNHFRRAGVEPNIVYETSQVDAGQNMVELGVGLWVVASHVIDGRLVKGLVARDLSDFAEIQIGYAWRSEDMSDILNAAIGAIEGQFSD